MPDQPSTTEPTTPGTAQPAVPAVPTLPQPSTLAPITVPGVPAPAAPPSAEALALLAAAVARIPAPPANGAADLPVEIYMTPLDWQRRKKTRWPTACLAASLAGWDPRCDEDLVVTEAEYDAAIVAANTKVEECRLAAAKLPDPGSARRVFVLAHIGDMGAVVCYKPSVAEATALLRQLRDRETPAEMSEQQLMAAMWQRCLWPAAGSPEHQRMVDDRPLDYGVSYPNAYMRALGLSSEDVRRR